jgi:acetyl esterase/lipase
MRILTAIAIVAGLGWQAGAIVQEPLRSLVLGPDTASADIVLSRAPSGTAADVVVRHDVRYGVVRGHQLLLDAYMPRSGGRPRAAIIFVHGGGWTGGDKRTFAPGEATFEPTALMLVRLGWVVFSVNYRLAPVAPFPAAPTDLARAILWLREHAQAFGVAPSRLGLWGASAGANVAALVATAGHGRLDVGSRVRAVVAWSGPMDLALFDRQVRVARTRRLVEDYLGCSLITCPARYRHASPTGQVDPSDPPMLIVNSSHEIVPLSQAQEMARALAAARVEYSLLVITGRRHAANYLSAALAPTIGFLKRYVRP